MSVYKTVTVNARFVNPKINADASVVGKTIQTNANILHDVRHNPVYDYELLDKKPSIEDVTLIGNKTFEDLGLFSATNLDIEAILQS